MTPVDEAERAAIVELGAALSGAQASSIAASLEAGETLTQALGVVEQSSRRRLRDLMSRAGLGVLDQARTIAVLRAIEGAHAHPTSITPVWTVPGGPGSLGVSGHLTGLTHALVTGAYSSVTCSTYNIARSSALWEALKQAAARPQVSVRLYLDTDVADADPVPWSPTTRQVAEELPGAVVVQCEPVAMVRVALAYLDRGEEAKLGVEPQYLRRPDIHGGVPQPHGR